MTWPPAVGVSKARATHRLEQLRDAGLVEGTRQGTNVSQGPRRDGLGPLRHVLDPADRLHR